MRIQEFSPNGRGGGGGGGGGGWGGGGGVEGPGPPDSKKLGQRCFVIFAVF